MANANGVWTYAPTGLADGVHTIVASETNAAGTGTASLSFTLDSKAPAVTAGLRSDTGASATDKVTSSAALTGTGDTGAVVHFTVDGSALAATATADANGLWSYIPTGLAEGMHTIVATETDLAGNAGSASLTFTLDTTAPVVTESLVNGGNATSLAGTSDGNAAVHFTVDGSVIADTAMADASGHWSFTPSGLANGAHTVVASETDLAGNTGSASLTFTLQTQPSFTGLIPGSGSVLLTGNAGEAGDVVEIYDGSSWIGWTTTDANGTWSYTASAASNGVHSFGFNVYDQAGNVIHGTNSAILGSSKADPLTGSTGNDIISASGGNDTIVGRAGGDRLTGGAGKDTFAYHAAADSTPAAADTITDFQHGIDKIDFTNIAGINATNGVPRFQGNITGGGNLTLNAHSVAFVETGGSTHVLVNTTNATETVTTSDTHAANMEITLVGVHLGLTSTDFHHT
jgi:Ca2+-binding RTX toxin-like protein